MPRGNEDELGGLGGVTMISIGADDPIELPAISALDYAEHKLGSEIMIDDVVLGWYEAARARYGDIVEMRNGKSLVVGETEGQHPVGRYSVRGLDQLRQYRKDIKTGDVICEFYDDAVASVDADCTRVACDCGANFCSHRVAAVYTALALMKGDDLPAEVAAHREAFKAFLANRDDHGALTAAAGTGALALAASEVHMHFVDPADRDPIELPNTPFARKHPDKVRRRLRSARRLGLPTYEPGKLVYTWDQTLNQVVDACATAMKSNPNGSGFTACLYGPPSTGKSFIGKLLAAERHLPMYEVNFGQNADLEMYIGTQGLEGGDTAIQYGPMTKAATADGGAMIVINEAVNIHPDQMSLLHDMIGSGGPGEERFITISAPSGSKEKPVRLPVHPDTIFILTYNPGKSGRHLPEAVESRCVMMEVDALKPDEEKERLAAQVYASIGALMKRPEDKGGGGWAYDPAKTKQGGTATDAQSKKVQVQVPVPITDQIGELEKECARAVSAFGKLRQAYNTGDLEVYPDMRTMQQFVRTILLKRHSSSPGVKPEERPRKAVEAALGLIQHLGELDRTPKERREQLIDLIKSDYKDELAATASVA